MKMKKIDIREIEGFTLGTAENADAATGVTVIIADEGAVAGVDVRGGGPATRETDLLRSENTVEKINAVVLSGGSAFGLEAASGVMRSLAERGAGVKIGDISVPIVTGASLFDLAVGSSDVFPDVDMGRQAVENAYAGQFETGNHGAGTGASVGKYMGMNRAMKTGLGTFACGDEVIKVGAIAAVNAVGDIYNGAGNIIAGLRTSDGTAIQGTIRVLKGMVHEESAPEINLSDIRMMAASEALERMRPVNTENSDNTAILSEESAATDEKSDIIQAMMRSYEQEQSAANADSASADGVQISDTSEAEEAMTQDPQEPDDAASYAEYDTAAEDTMTSDHISAGSYYEDDHYTEYTGGVSKSEVSEVSDYSDVDSEPEAPVEMTDEADAGSLEEEVSDDGDAAVSIEDEYILSEEDKADMGYDIPFNTTISCLITNAELTKSQANKLASILHDAYARAIKPVHGTLDGDTVFVMSTGEHKVNFDAFAALATDVMQYAIIDGASSATGAYGLPAARDIIHK